MRLPTVIFVRQGVEVMTRVRSWETQCARLGLLVKRYASSESGVQRYYYGHSRKNVVRPGDLLVIG